MAFEQRDNAGSLFKNDRKRDGKNDPDYTGQAIIGGVAYWQDCWIKNDPRKPGYDSSKKTFLSTSYRPKDEGKSQSTTGRQPERQAAPPTRSTPRPPSRPPQRDPDLGPEGPDIDF